MPTPVIPESLIERKYEKQTDQNGNRVRPRDLNRSPNVTDRREEFISEHNASISDDSHERMLWFSNCLSKKQRQKRARSIIKYKLVRHLRAEWLDGSLTFSKCQLEHGQEVEVCIEAVASVPVMSVYTQTERNWAIRRLMEDIFGNRRKTYLRKQKLSNIERTIVQPSSRIAQDNSGPRTRENGSTTTTELVTSASNQSVPTRADNAGAVTYCTRTVNNSSASMKQRPEIEKTNSFANQVTIQTETNHPGRTSMTENEAIIASSIEFQRIQDTPAPRPFPSGVNRTDGDSVSNDNVQNEHVEVSRLQEESIDDIEKQIEALKCKKPPLEHDQGRCRIQENQRQEIQSDEIQSDEIRPLEIQPRKGGRGRGKKTLGPRRRRDNC